MIDTQTVKLANVQSLTIKTTKLKSVGKYAFKGIAKQATIKCPAKKLKKYSKKARWQRWWRLSRVFC